MHNPEKCNFLWKLFKRAPVLLLLLCIPSFAQSVASLSGTVTDSSGAVVPGSQIVLKNTGTGLTYQATTDETGTYRFPTLPIGNYDLSANHAGFSPISIRGIVLVTGRAADYPVSLQPGPVSQSVNVSEVSQEVQPTSSELLTTIEHKSMEDLPLNGRNPLTLVLLVPGTISQGDSASFQSANPRVTVNGNRGTDNGYRLDGVFFTDTHFGTAPILPSPDALQEFTVKTTNFGAQESGAGANVQFTTRSGTNHFHGSVFEYLRNDYLDARNYFATSVTPYKRNQFGGTLGGPILHDRTFFFGSYQGTRTVGGANPAIATVPSSAERSGDFSELSRTIINPATGTPYPGNIVTTPFDPVTAKFIAYIPLPNLPNNQYESNPRSQINDDQYLVRIDHQLTSKDRFTARFYYDDYEFEEQTTPITSFYGLDKFLNRNLFVSDTHTFSPNLILSAAFGFTNSGRSRAAVMPLTVQAAGANVPLATPGSPDQVTISLTGYSSLSSGTPIYIVPKTYDYLAHVIWIHGRHQVSAGIEVMRNLENAFDRSSQSGTYGFNGSRTSNSAYPNSGDAFADFLLGLPYTFAQKGTSPQRIYETKIQPYIQDDWKVARRLTLNLGVRWDPWLPATDRVAPQVGFEPGVHSLVGPGAPTGMVFSGDPGLPHAIFHRDMNNIAPRVGFAYDVTGNATTVLRGGYGIFYRPMPLNLQRFSSNTAAFRSLSVQIPNPQSFEEPYAGFSGGTPFPWTVPTQDQLGSYVFSLPVTTSGLVPSSSTSYVQEWTLTLERQLHAFGLAATYVGNHMIKGMDATEGNPGVYGPGATTGNINSRRLYAGLASVEILSSFNMSNYNALQLTANKHASHGLTLISNYTWAKCMDNDSQTTGVVTVINKFNFRANYARCDWDVEQAGTISTVYDLPVVTAFHGVADKFLNHWQFSGIFTAAKGQPFNVYSGTDRALSGTTTNSSIYDLTDLVPGVSTRRPAGVDEKVQYFNKAAFQPAALGTFGNSGRNAYFAPGKWNLDIGILKSFPIYKSLQATLRGEAFNVFNNTKLGAPVATYTNANFGKITSAGDPRVLQVSMRLSF